MLYRKSTTSRRSAHLREGLGVDESLEHVLVRSHAVGRLHLGLLEHLTRCTIRRIQRWGQSTTSRDSRHCSIQAQRDRRLAKWNIISLALSRHGELRSSPFQMLDNSTTDVYAGDTNLFAAYFLSVLPPLSLSLSACTHVARSSQHRRHQAPKINSTSLP